MYIEKMQFEKKLNVFWKKKLKKKMNFEKINFENMNFEKNSSILLVLLLNFFMKVQTNKTPLNIY